MSTIINLTQHKSTREQVNQGVIDLPKDYQDKLIEAITFHELPKKEEIEKKAKEVCNLVVGFISETGILNPHFMIGGVPFMMSSLEKELSPIGNVLYAFSKRESIEEVLESGETIKKSIFKHIGFVRV